MNKIYRTKWRINGSWNIGPWRSDEKEAMADCPTYVDDGDYEAASFEWRITTADGPKPVPAPERWSNQFAMTDAKRAFIRESSRIHCEEMAARPFGYDGLVAAYVQALLSNPSIAPKIPPRDWAISNYILEFAETMAALVYDARDKYKESEE